LIIENTNAIENERPERTSDGVLARYTKEGIQALYPQLTPEKIQALTSATVKSGLFPA
jgi:acyl CoA:acetate/3-ketoacid CoA transferase beta subunit